MSSISRNTGLVRPNCTIKATRWRSFAHAPIRDDFVLECQLLLLSFSIGIQDAASFPDYHCFASNQTGNTVLLAVGVAKITTLFSLSNIGISLSMFVLGGFLPGQLGNYFGSRKRWWLIVTSFFQTALVFVASAIQYAGPDPIPDKGTVALVVISLLAFSSGAQVAMARGLQITDITTAMATAAYVDIFIDEKMFERGNRKRNRRVAFLLSLFAGSFAGAFAYKAKGSPFTLLISGIGKGVAAISLFANKGMGDERYMDPRDNEVIV